MKHNFKIQHLLISWFHWYRNLHMKTSWTLYQWHCISA